MSRAGELAEGIEMIIQRAYDAGGIQTFDDFETYFMEACDATGIIDDGRLRGAIRQIVRVQSPVFLALRREAAEVNRPITEESPIDHLPLSNATRLHLLYGGIRKVGQIINVLAHQGQTGLLAFRHIGPKSLQEIYDALDWAEIEIPPQLEPEEGETIPVYGHNIELPEKEEQELIARGAGQERKIILDNGETFKAEIFPGNSGEIVIIGHKQLTVRARKIVLEAFG